MKGAIFLLLAFAQALFCKGACLAQLSTPSPLGPQKYELQLVSIFEGAKPELIFVVGGSGFRSIDSLKRFLGKLPLGAELTWAPGCILIGGEPLLSSESEMSDFKEFLEKTGIKFTLAPSG